jgi:hypothetical protein
MYIEDSQLRMKLKGKLKTGRKSGDLFMLWIVAYPHYMKIEIESVA